MRTRSVDQMRFADSPPPSQPVVHRREAETVGRDKDGYPRSRGWRVVERGTSEKKIEIADETDKEEAEEEVAKEE